MKLWTLSGVFCLQSTHKSVLFCWCSQNKNSWLAQEVHTGSSSFIQTQLLCKLIILLDGTNEITKHSGYQHIWECGVTSGLKQVVGSVDISKHHILVICEPYPNYYLLSTSHICNPIDLQSTAMEYQDHNAHTMVTQLYFYPHNRINDTDPCSVRDITQITWTSSEGGKKVVHEWSHDRVSPVHLQ